MPVNVSWSDSAQPLGSLADGTRVTIATDGASAVFEFDRDGNVSSSSDVTISLIDEVRPAAR